jgi:UrcA family protein
MIRIAPIALALAVLPYAAFAGSGDDQAPAVRQAFTPRDDVVIQQTQVRYADLDLSSEAGVQALIGRIEAAAEAVCRARPPGGPEPLASDAQVECRREVIGKTACGFHNRRLWTLAVERARELTPSP